MRQLAPARSRLARTAQVTAVCGVAVEIAQTVFDPALPTDASTALSRLATSRAVGFSRVVDLFGLLLLLIAVAVTTEALRGLPGSSMARVALVMFTVSTAAAAIATMVVAALPDVARSWASAPPSEQPAYRSGYHILIHVSGAVFAVAWASLGAYDLLVAAAVKDNGRFPRALPWISAAAGLAVLAAVPLGVSGSNVAFVLLLTGLLLFYVALITTTLRLPAVGATRHSDSAGGDPPAGPGQLQRADRHALRGSAHWGNPQSSARGDSD
jgi:hypothetical protein